MKEDPGETGHRLQENQGIKAVFIGLCDRLLQFRHALRERRQIGEIVPPNQTQQPDDPCQQAHRSVGGQNSNRMTALVTDGFA